MLMMCSSDGCCLATMKGETSIRKHAVWRLSEVQISAQRFDDTAQAVLVQAAVEHGTQIGLQAKLLIQSAHGTDLPIGEVVASQRRNDSVFCRSGSRITVPSLSHVQGRRIRVLRAPDPAPTILLLPFRGELGALGFDLEEEEAVTDGCRQVTEPCLGIACQIDASVSSPGSQTPDK